VTKSVITNIPAIMTFCLLCIAPKLSSSIISRSSNTERFSVKMVKSAIQFLQKKNQVDGYIKKNEESKRQLRNHKKYREQNFKIEQAIEFV